MNDSGTANEPWYKEPYAWMVFGIPAGTILCCLVLISIAVSNRDALVVDDYYKQGLAINRVLAREASAAARGITVLALDITAQRVTLELGGNHGSATAVLDVTFMHATRAGLDQRVAVRRDADGRYTGALRPLVPGRWYVDISTPGWRVVHPIRITAPTPRAG